MLKSLVLLAVMTIQLQASENPEFLGTLAGEITYVTSNLSPNQPTYTRNYRAFMGSDSLRVGLAKEADCWGYKNLGEITALKDGGFFRVVKTYEYENVHEPIKDFGRFLNCFQYALGTYGSKLEQVAEKSIEQIQDSVGECIDIAVKDYFEPINNKPQDGDLVIYETKFGTNSHAGIYRKSKPLSRSASGGTVESKWGGFGLGRPPCIYVFQHDVFFVPDFYGDRAKFYRLKTK